MTRSGALARLEPIVSDPGRSGLFCDFDGTLSEIIDQPDLARPADGSAALLGDLARSIGLVGVLSGRPVEFLRSFFPDAVLLAGLYGLETVTIRYFNVFGPRQDPSSPYSGVIALFITRRQQNDGQVARSRL